MSSFVPAVLQNAVPHEVVRSLGVIHRGRGKQELYKERAPEMSRLLTVLLLNKQGFDAGRYIAIERLIEQTKESYYDTPLLSG